MCVFYAWQPSTFVIMLCLPLSLSFSACKAKNYLSLRHFFTIVMLTFSSSSFIIHHNTSSFKVDHFFGIDSQSMHLITLKKLNHCD